MRKILKTTLVVALTVGGSVSFAQLSSQEVSKKTVAEKRAEQRDYGIREGESVEYCGTHWKMQEMMQKFPAFKEMHKQVQKQLKSEQEAYQQQLLEKGKDQTGNPLAKGTVYTIPVVFHVLHQNGAENISSQQIYNAVDILNRDYAKLNPDTAFVAAPFQGMPANPEIQFALATKAPNGACFNGITRTVTPLTFDGSNGSAQVNAVISGNDVYQGSWPGDEYLNIFVAAEIGGAAGYTTKPSFWSGTGMTNGIWVLQNYVGSIGTGTVGRSRTLTHEVGHWLNLDHLWGGSNNPGLPSNCSAGSDDQVNDTPECIGVTSCNLTSNTCSLDNAYWGFDQIDNIENYMEYSYCSKMFTQGQVDRMRTAIVSSVGGRNNIWTGSNLVAVGAAGNAVLCKADFKADILQVCTGDAVNFEDQSFFNQNSWNWTFQGGTPANSTDQNPTVVYNTPGTYTVTLQVGDGTSSVSETKTSYITVLPATGAATPFTEGFESVTSLPSTDWKIFNFDNGPAWSSTTSAAYSGSRSVFIENPASNVGNVDELVSNTIDLSAATEVRLSFKYAYAKRSFSNTDKLQVWVSGDCGRSWALRKSITAASLTTASNYISNAWSPNGQSEWKESVITNITSVFWTSNFRIKFVFTGGGGNNVFIDDINLTSTPVGIEENGLLGGINVYPNPMNNKATLTFHLMNNATVEAELVDVVGKKVAQVLPQQEMIAGKQQVDFSGQGLSQGVYFIRVKAGDVVLSRKVVID